MQVAALLALRHEIRAYVVEDGPKAEKLINALTNAVQPFWKAGFKRHLRHVVANAAAKGCLDSLAAAARRATL